LAANRFYTANRTIIKSHFYSAKSRIKGTPTHNDFSGNLRLAKVISSTIQHYPKDHPMSIFAVTNANAKTVQNQDDIAFGQETKTSSNRVTIFLDPDQEFDPETGLYYYKARLYDPSLGMFITPDPYFSPNLVESVIYSCWRLR
jgi:RHS repeat-associated protein